MKDILPFFLSFEEDKKRITGRYLPTALLASGFAERTLGASELFRCTVPANDYGGNHDRNYIVLLSADRHQLFSCDPQLFAAKSIALYFDRNTISGTYIGRNALPSHFRSRLFDLASPCQSVWIDGAQTALLQCGLSARATQDHPPA